MNRKEFFMDIFDSFFVTFTVAAMGTTFYLHLFGHQTARLVDIVAIFIISLLTSLAGLVFYSKKEPRRRGLIIRYLIHASLIFSIIFSAATYMGWIYWGALATVVPFAVLIIGIFVSVHGIIFLQTKLLADELNKKLEERYRK